MNYATGTPLHQAEWWAVIGGVDYLVELHPHAGSAGRVTAARWGDRNVKRASASRRYVGPDGLMPRATDPAIAVVPAWTTAGIEAEFGERWQLERTMDHDFRSA